MNNLQQIGHAIHNYHEAHGHLPGPMRDRAGRPLLSWRVTILPHMDADSLYTRFHRDEPWDSSHNLALLDEMPGFYHPSNQEHAQPPNTFYRQVTGPGTAFERDTLTLNDITDGLDRTIFVVEAGDAVPWTKSEEWESYPDRPVPPVGGIFRRTGGFGDFWRHYDGTNVLLGDGGVRFLRRDTPEAMWRALATRNGGEKVEVP